MTVELTPQTFLTAASVITAAYLLVERFAKGVRWFDKQDKQTKDIAALEEKHDADIKGIMVEQRLMTRGILACLKGLSEQGCNGPVTNSIDEIETYLNDKAHDQ